MTTKNNHLYWLKWLCVASLCYTGSAVGQDQAQRSAENNVEFRIGYGYSDNILRDSTANIESGYTAAGITLDVNVDRPRLRFEALGDLDYLFYEESSVRNRPDGDIDASIAFRVVPERFELYADGTYSQFRQNATLGDTPDNLSEFFVLRGGARGTIPIGQRSALQLDASLSDRNFQDQDDLDSSETTIGLGLFRQIRPRSSVSLIANTSTVDYDDVAGTEYDILRLFVRYESVLGSGDFSVDLGLNQLDDESVANEDSAQPLLALTWSREVGARSSLDIEASHRIVDLGSSANVGNVSGAAPGRSGRLTPTQSPFSETTLSFGQSTQLERTLIGFGLNFAQQMYEDPAQEDINVIGVNAFVRRDLTNTVTVSLGASLTERVGIQTTTESDDLIATLALRKSFSRRLSASLEYRFSTRDASNNSDFDENAAFLSVSYSPTGN